FQDYELSRDVPITILIDDQAKGYGELLANTLRISQRAIVVGAGAEDKTGGHSFEINHAVLEPNKPNNKFQYLFGLTFDLDGNLLANRGMSYDIHLNAQTGEFSTSKTQNPSLPWQRLGNHFFRNSFFSKKIEPLPYYDYGMVSPSIIHYLSNRHYSRVIDNVRTSVDPPKDQVSLNWGDFMNDINLSKENNRRLAKDMLLLSKYEYAGHRGVNNKTRRAIEIIKKDATLDETLQIASDYFYYLKKGKDDGEFQIVDFQVLTNPENPY
ncbi:MAG: hypothetical protein OXC40_07665, partial [Proteobacteria bacterium]|nr:hypothetical protein [Pseudomonadota bacterium]